MLQQPQPALPRACQPPGKEGLPPPACCSGIRGGRGRHQGGLRAGPLAVVTVNCGCSRGPRAHSSLPSVAATAADVTSGTGHSPPFRFLLVFFLWAFLPAALFFLLLLFFHLHAHSPSISPPPLLPPCFASFFLSSSKARHYYQIIKRPMDLSIIRRKLQKKDPAHYTTPEEVVSDVRLMFWNCAKFNYVCGVCFPSLPSPVTPRLSWLGRGGGVRFDPGPPEGPGRRLLGLL